MKFRTHCNSLLVESELSFYSSGCTKLLIDNIELSIDTGLPYASFDYFTFCTEKILDNYISLHFFKKYNDVYTYLIDYTKIQSSNIFLDKLNIKDFKAMSSKLNISNTMLLNFSRGHACIPLEKGLLLSSLLNINPEEFIEYRSDFMLLTLLKSRFKCTKKK